MKIIERNNSTVTIEHDNTRVVVTHDIYNSYVNGLLTIDDLVKNGIVISVKWSDFINLDITASDIEYNLHRHGVHTVDDLLKNIQAVNGAIFAAMGVTASTLHKAIKNSKKELGG